MTPFATYPSLRGRNVFITGGGSGIGASIVENFCEQGSRVTFVDIAQDASHALCEAIAKKGHARPDFVKCDIHDVNALQAIIEKAGAKQPIGALVNNAANDDRHDFRKVTPEYWDERFAVNLRHQFFAAQAVYPQMKALGGGSIVNFGSISWMTSTGGMAAYTSAKSAVQGLTRSLARDFGPDKIRVNTLVPGWVMTERQIKLWLDPDSERKMLDLQCLKEKLYPPDIARMVLFLAADDSRLCTAQDFVVDAGWT